MSERPHHWLTRLYPSAWRDRYGDEMDELLNYGCGWRDMLDVVRSAAFERLRHSSGVGVEAMPTYPSNVAVLVRKPSAVVPIAMSLCALGVVLLASVLLALALLAALRVLRGFKPDERMRSGA